MLENTKITGLFEAMQTFEHIRPVVNTRPRPFGETDIDMKNMK